MSSKVVKPGSAPRAVQISCARVQGAGGRTGVTRAAVATADRSAMGCPRPLSPRASTLRIQLLYYRPGSSSSRRAWCAVDSTVAEKPLRSWRARRNIRPACMRQNRSADDEPHLIIIFQCIMKKNCFSLCRNE